MTSTPDSPDRVADEAARIRDRLTSSTMAAGPATVLVELWNPLPAPANQNRTWKLNDDPDHHRHDDDQRRDRSRRCAGSRQRAPWEVSWLPGRTLDRKSAITAMVLATTLANVT